MRRAAVLFVLIGLAIGAYQALFHPNTPLPRAWNPVEPLIVTDPETALTRWKLRRALRDPATCLAALVPAMEGVALSPFEVNENCHIRNRVRLNEVGLARINAVETSCAVGLRLAMWEHHGLQPAAERHLGVALIGIDQIGSYNCRAIRSTGGATGQMSTHATAEAIDITGFDFADGTKFTLLTDWNGEDAAFLEAARDSACDWFAAVLGPDFNSLHADHFHLQSRGWGTCR